MILQIVLTLINIVLSAICYRAGGMSTDPTAEPTWMPMWMRKSWVRDWICPFFSLFTLFLWFTPTVWWGYLLGIVAYGIMGASFSTYWDWLFGFDNYWFHGFAIGLSVFPICFAGLAWWLVLIQAVCMAVSMGLWCLLIGNDVKEEMGRGAFAVLFRVIA